MMLKIRTKYKINFTKQKGLIDMFNYKKMFVFLTSSIIIMLFLTSCVSDVIESELPDTSASMNMETVEKNSETKNNTEPAISSENSETGYTETSINMETIENNSETVINSESYETSYTETSIESDITDISEGIITETSNYNSYDEEETYTARQAPDTTLISAETDAIAENDPSDPPESVVTEINNIDTSSVTVSTHNSSSQTESSKNENEQEDLSSIKSERIVNTKYDVCQAVLIADDIYYIGYNYDSVTPYIFTLNSNDEFVNSVKLAKDAGNFDVKQLDDKIYVMYNTYFEHNATGLYCKIFDEQLNLLEDHDLSSYSMDWIGQTDVNENNIFYAKDMKIYSVDHNKKNKKIIFDLSNEDCDANYITAIAASNDYIGLKLQDSNNDYYYGVLDLKTGKSQIIKDNDIDFPQIYGDSIMWPGIGGYDNSGVFSSCQKIFVFNNGQFKTITTKTEKEVTNGSCSMTNDGKIVTTEYSEPKYGSEAFCIRLYDKTGKCIKEFLADFHSGMGGIRAGNRTITYNFDYEGKTSQGRPVASVEIIEY